MANKDNGSNNLMIISYCNRKSFAIKLGTAHHMHTHTCRRRRLCALVAVCVWWVYRIAKTNPLWVFAPAVTIWGMVGMESRRSPCVTLENYISLPFQSTNVILIDSPINKTFWSISIMRLYCPSHCGLPDTVVCLCDQIIWLNNLHFAEFRQ